MKIKKDELYFRIFNEVLRLDLEKGHLRWSISEVAKNSKITRSLIYYYFGKDKDVILDEAFKFMIKNIYSIEPINGKRESTVDRLDRVLKISKKYPYLFIHFYMNRTKDNEKGDYIRKSEKDFLKNLQKEFPGLGKNEVFLLYILELGAVTYQNLNKKQLLWVQEFLYEIYRRTRKSSRASKKR